MKLRVGNIYHIEENGPPEANGEFYFVGLVTVGSRDGDKNAARFEKLSNEGRLTIGTFVLDKMLRDGQIREPSEPELAKALLSA
jgi:hypothetical protein